MAADGPLRQVPVGAEEQEKILPLPVPLPHLEDRLFARHVVPPVPVEQQQPTEAVTDEILQQPRQQINVKPRFRRERPRKIEMMMRVAEPLQRREQGGRAQSLLGPARDLPHEQGIGEEWGVRPVLLERSHRKHHGRIPVKGGDFGPSVFGEPHGAKGSARSPPRDQAGSGAECARPPPRLTNQGGRTWVRRDGTEHSRGRIRGAYL